METNTNQRGVETGEKIDINGQNIVTGHECETVELTTSIRDRQHETYPLLNTPVACTPNKPPIPSTR